MGNIKEYHKNIKTYKLYYQKNKERYLKNGKKWKRNNKVKIAFSKYKDSAKRRNLKFNITKDYFYKFFGKPCFYCNCNKNINGIDRINNNLGYIKDNMIPCCVVCNKMKSKSSKDEFILHCKKIINNINK